MRRKEILPLKRNNIQLHKTNSMLKFIYSIALFTNSIFHANAQQKANPEEVISKFVESFRQQAIQSDFTIKVSEKNSLNSQEFSGTIVLKADHFFLETDDLMVWFDGKTQWAYLKTGNEVNITNPTAEELAATNPVSIISSIRSVSRIQFGKSKNNLYQVIELIPQNKKNDFRKIEIRIDKKSDIPHTINIEYQNGIKNELIFTNYRKNVSINPKTFVFDKTKYKEVLINDLR